jgi:hypothetical protein
MQFVSTHNTTKLGNIIFLAGKLRHPDFHTGLVAKVNRVVVAKPTATPLAVGISTYFAKSFFVLKGCLQLAILIVVVWHERMANAAI